MRDFKLFRRTIGVLIFSLFFLTTVSVHAADLLWAIPKLSLRSDQTKVAIEPTLREPPEELVKSNARPTSIAPYIVGGVPAYRGEYPEYSSLWVDGLDGYIYFICGGTLLSSNKVLTAAHCTSDFAASRFVVIPNYYSHDDAITVDQLYQASSKVIHPQYNSTTFNNDISILYLGRSATTAKVKIYGGSSQFTNNLATVIGLGSLFGVDGPFPTILQKVNLPTVSNATCSTYWGNSITSSMLCAGYTSTNKSACLGDSGGPLFLNYDNQRVQIGIVSWGDETCTGYNVYSRISNLISFIRTYAPGAIIITDTFPSSDIGWLPAIYLLLPLD